MNNVFNDRNLSTSQPMTQREALEPTPADLWGMQRQALGERSDRELLELAAKAMGYAVEEWCAERGLWVEIAPGRRTWWNPLTDDGDCFRLAVDTGMFEIDDYGIAHCEWGNYAQMRRAVVVAFANTFRA